MFYILQVACQFPPEASSPPVVLLNAKEDGGSLQISVLIRKYLDRPTSKPCIRPNHQIKSRRLPGTVDRPEDGEELPPHRGVGFEVEFLEFLDQVFHRPVDCDPEEVGLQFPVTVQLDPHRGVPLPLPLPVADRIAANFQWGFPEVLNGLSFPLEKRVLPVGRQEHEESPPSQILDVGHPGELSPVALMFAPLDAVLTQKFLVRFARIFPRWDFSADVKEVSSRQVADGELLNESGQVVRNVLIAHGYFDAWGKVEDCFVWGHSPPKALNLRHGLGFANPANLLALLAAMLWNLTAFVKTSGRRFVALLRRALHRGTGAFGSRFRYRGRPIMEVAP